MHESRKSIDHLFALSSGLRTMSFGKITDIMTFSFRYLGNTIKDKVLWQVTYPILIWIVWWKRNIRIFKDKCRTLETL